MHISEQFEVEAFDGSIEVKKHMPALMYLTSSAGYKSILQLNFLLLIADPFEEQKKSVLKPKIKPLSYPHENNMDKPFDFDIKFLQKCFKARVDKHYQLQSTAEFNNIIANLIKNEFPAYRAVLNMIQPVHLTKKTIGAAPTTPKASTRSTRSSKTDILNNIDKEYPEYTNFSKNLRSIKQKKKLKGLKNDEFKKLLTDNIDKATKKLFETSDEIIAENKKKKLDLENLNEKVKGLKQENKSLKTFLTEDEYKIVKNQGNLDDFFKKRAESIDTDIIKREEEIVDQMTANDLMVTVAKPIFEKLEKNYESIQKYKDEGGCVAMSKDTFEKIMYESLTQEQMDDIEENKVVELYI